MSIQSAVTEYLIRERKALSGQGHVDLRQIAEDVAKERGLCPLKLRAAIIDATLAGPC